VIADDFANERELPFGDLMLIRRDVANPRADGGVGDTLVNHLGGGDAEDPADTVVEKHLEFLEKLVAKRPNLAPPQHERKGEDGRFGGGNVMGAKKPGGGKKMASVLDALLALRTCISSTNFSNCR